MVKVLIFLTDVFLQLKILSSLLENRQHLLTPKIQLPPVVLIEINFFLIGNVLTYTRFQKLKNCV